MTTLEELLESDLRAVLEDSQYEAFAASDAGKLWLANHKPEADPAAAPVGAPR